MKKPILLLLALAIVIPGIVCAQVPTGAITGMVVGLVSALVLVAIGPNIWSPEAGKAILVGKPLFSLGNPGIVSIPLGFIGAYLGTVLSNKKVDEKKFDEILVKANTGL